MDLAATADDFPQKSHMRILHLCPSLAGGGAERQLCYLSRELGRRGHLVDVAVLNSGPNIDLLSGAQNVHLHLLGPDNVVVHGGPSLRNYNPLLFTRISALLRRLRPDIVQTWISQMDVLGGLAALSRRVPWVVREPASSLMYADGGIKVALRSWLARTASLIVANSDAGSNYWGSISSSIRRIVIRNGVPLSELDCAPRLSDLDIEAGKQLILYAGRFDREKNIERTATAIREAVMHSPAQAIICGAGPLKPAIEKIIEPVGSKIKLWPYQRELWSLMKRADVFVSVSHNEGSPNTVLEAMGCRCPLVVSDIPAHREILSPSSAEFVHSQSSDSIAEGILRVLANQQLTQKRVQEAYLRAKQLSVEEMTTRYESAYRSVSRIQ